MLSKRMQEALNDQINAELYSAYLYLAMSNHFAAKNFPGMAKWLKVQASEELGHAMKFFEYLHERLGEATLGRVEAPPAHWSSPLAAFQEVFKHEQEVTARIHKLADLAADEKDHATGIFLHWFVKEQVEEEASAAQIVEKLKMLGDLAGAMFMLDHELGGRA